MNFLVYRGFGITYPKLIQSYILIIFDIKA